MNDLGAAAKAFREYLSVHPIGAQLSGQAVDVMAAELERMCMAFEEDARAETSDQLREVVDRMQCWHSDGVAHLREVNRNVNAGTTLKLGENDEGTVLTKREAGLFKAGVEAALQVLGTLPFTVSASDDEQEADDEPE